VFYLKELAKEFLLEKKCFWNKVDTTYFSAALTHNTPKYLEGNSAQEKLKGFSPLKYAILSFGKCLK